MRFFLLLSVFSSFLVGYTSSSNSSEVAPTKALSSSSEKLGGVTGSPISELDKFFRPKRSLAEIVDSEKCGSIKSKIKALRKKGCIKLNSTKKSLLEFAFGHGDSIFITFCAIVFAVVGGILNLLVLVAILHYSTTRKHVTTPFIVSTTVSDLIYSVVLLPIMAMRFYHQKNPLSDTMCQIYPVLYYTTQGASLFSLTMVTLNRAVMLFFPTKADKIFTNIKLIRGNYVPINSILILLVCWLIPFLGLLPTIFGKNGCLGLQHITQSCTILADNEGHSPKSMMYSVVFFIPTFTMIVTDIAIYFKLRSMQSSEAGLGDDNKMEKRFIKMLATILFIFILTYMPGFLIKRFDKCYKKPTLHAVAYVFNWASVWLNPIIYIVGQKKYQDAIKYLFGRFSTQKQNNTKQFIPSLNMSSDNPEAVEVKQNTSGDQGCFARCCNRQGDN